MSDYRAHLSHLSVPAQKVRLVVDQISRQRCQRGARYFALHPQTGGCVRCTSC